MYYPFFEYFVRIHITFFPEKNICMKQSEYKNFINKGKKILFNVTKLMNNELLGKKKIKIKIKKLNIAGKFLVRKRNRKTFFSK